MAPGYYETMHSDFPSLKQKKPAKGVLEKGKIITRSEKVLKAKEDKPYDDDATPGPTSYDYRPTWFKRSFNTNFIAQPQL